MEYYAHFFTILALVAILLWQSKVIQKTERERDQLRIDLGGKLYRAQAEIRALESKLLEREVRS